MKATTTFLFSAAGCLCFNLLAGAQETTYEFMPDPATDGGFATPSYITFSSPSGSIDAAAGAASVTDAIVAFWINLPGNVSFALGAPPASGIPSGSLESGETDLASWGGATLSDLDLFVSGDGKNVELKPTEIDNSPYPSLPSYWDQEVVGIPFPVSDSSPTVALLLAAAAILLAAHTLKARSPAAAP